MSISTKDSYQDFFDKTCISPEEFFEFGLNEIIFAEPSKVIREWKDLKKRIKNNQAAYIRGYGRNASGTKLYLALYEKVFCNTNIVKDPTNNYAPTEVLRRTTGYSKTVHSKYKRIQNFQVAHVFGRTKNPFSFTAPWNIVYVPKIVDPFTGHEAKGPWVAKFTASFQKRTYEEFRDHIIDFNSIVSDAKLRKRLKDSIEEIVEDYNLDEKSATDFKESVDSEFAEIKI